VAHLPVLRLHWRPTVMHEQVQEGTHITGCALLLHILLLSLNACQERCSTLCGRKGLQEKTANPMQSCIVLHLLLRPV
jgi:hypothetical protein